MLERLPSELLPAVLAAIEDATARRKAAEALVQVCGPLRRAVRPVLGAWLAATALEALALQAAPLTEGAARLGELLLASRRAGQQPIAVDPALLVQPLAGPGPVFAWGGRLWFSGLGAAPAALRRDPLTGGALLIARSAASLVLATMVAHSAAADASVMPDLNVSLPQPLWAVQSWAVPAPWMPPSRLTLARQHPSYAAAKRAIQAVYTRQAAGTELDPFTEDYACLWALAARHPRVLSCWDWAGLTVDLDNTRTRRVLHYSLREGGYSSDPAEGFAGLEACLGMTANKAAAEWDARLLIEERAAQSARPRW